ncbi:MAG: FMN-binding negative transcriptional regulator [Balneola sp.]
MYIPSSFTEEDPKILFKLIEEYNFGILFSQHYEQPEATHLPFLVDRQRGDHGVLIAHFAKANKHWRKLIESKKVLAVFQGPHSYISPSWYEDRAEVPTWNYATVHAYGIPRIIHDSSELRDMVTRLTHHHEDEIKSDWSIDEVSKQDFETDLKAIVGIEIEITRLEGKFKFNQNKTEADQAKVIKNLDKRNRNEVSDIMKKNLSRK